MHASRHFILVATMSCVCVTTWHNSANAADSRKWKTTALALGVSTANKSVRVWVGITNPTTTWRMICVRGVWYSFFGDTGLEAGGAAQPLVTHACTDGFGQQLVPPNTTYFTAGTLPLDSIAQTKHKVRIGIDLVESDPITEQVLSQESVVWLGTLAEASDAGKKLLQLPAQ